MRNVTIIATMSLVAVGLAGCGGHSRLPSGPSLAGGPNPLPGSSCANPTPAGTMDATVTSNVPSDSDPTAANITPTTHVPVVVLTPKRCPGETFPLVLYGHGFGEDRTTDDGAGLIDGGHLQLLVDRGYVVIRFDERGHGDNRPAKGGDFSRLMDPAAESQDAGAILDWAYKNAATISVQTESESDTGIAKDLKVGLLGGSYGGMFQWPLAALDPRIDVIAPDRSPHDLLYSLLPGDAIKGWMRLFSLLIQLPVGGTPAGDNVTATPLAQTIANQVGPLGPNAGLVRTRADLVMYATAPTAVPRPVTEQEVQDLAYTHSMDYFESQQAAGKPWGFGETSAKLRPIPALFTQGQRDVLFNATDAYWNSRYFAATGADVRVLTTEDGHMNPLAGQARGLWACGAHDAQTAILAWFDHHLKGVDSDAFRAIPKVCLSLLDSSDKTVKPVGVVLGAFPVGSLSGVGAVPAMAPTLKASVPSGSGITPIFVPIGEKIQGNDKVLAGIPRIAKLTVAPGTGSVQTAIAIVGVGVQRAGQILLVDQQVTAFVAGDHDSNRGVLHPGEGVLLPGVGERLQDGDQVGLLFYEQHAQYAPVASTQSAGGITTIAVLGNAAPPNPYDVTATGVELPILVPGQYPGSSLSQ